MVTIGILGVLSFGSQAHLEDKLSGLARRYRGSLGLAQDDRGRIFDALNADC